jgi:cytochrome bd-type quinol oxidase subunit 1
MRPLHQAARFWARVFSINFIMGVLTGIPVGHFTLLFRMFRGEVRLEGEGY